MISAASSASSLADVSGVGCGAALLLADFGGVCAGLAAGFLGAAVLAASSALRVAVFAAAGFAAAGFFVGPFLSGACAAGCAVFGVTFARLVDVVGALAFAPGIFVAADFVEACAVAFVLL